MSRIDVAPGERRPADGILPMTERLWDGLAIRPGEFGSAGRLSGSGSAKPRGRNTHRGPEFGERASFSGNGSKWEPVGVFHWFFPFCPPTVLSPGPRAGRQALEGQGVRDCIFTTKNANLTNDLMPRNCARARPVRVRGSIGQSAGRLVEWAMCARFSIVHNALNSEFH